MEQYTIEQVTAKVKELKKAIDASSGKIDVYNQNITDIKAEFEILRNKCLNDYGCKPNELSTLYDEKNDEVNQLINEAIKAYKKLTEENDN